MAIDQLIFTPVGTVIFYSAFKTMEGDAASIPATLREKFIPTLLAGYALWPMVHIINFRCCGCDGALAAFDKVIQSHDLKSWVLCAGSSAISTVCCTSMQCRYAAQACCLPAIDPHPLATEI